MRTNDWSAHASADNGTATATKAGAPGKRHVIGTVIASYDAAHTGVLTVKVGTTTVLTHDVVNSDVLPLELRGDLGAAVSAELEASGQAGIVGRVTIVGYTEG